MVAIRQRPASWEATSSWVSTCDDSVNRWESCGPEPRIFESWTPPMESDSSIWVCMSARVRCARIVTVRRIRATARVSRTAGGSTTRLSRASRQDRTAIATAVPTTVVRFEAIDVAELVTTDCIPLMSLVSRDWTSPPRVRVKKPSDIRCRWPNSEVRRPCITCWPTWVASQVCTTPKTAVSTATPSIAPTSQRSRLTSCWGRATSMSCLVMNGVARPTTEVATMSTTTMASGSRWGRNSAAIRRRLTGCSSSWRTSAGSLRAPPRPGPARVVGAAWENGWGCSCDHAFLAGESRSVRGESVRGVCLSGADYC